MEHPKALCWDPSYIYYTQQSYKTYFQTKIIFADDTALIIKFSKTDKDKLATLKEKLNYLLEHFTANKLKLNIGKTEILTNFATGEIKLGTDTIPVHGKTHTVKYLGVNINTALDWQTHIDSIRNKCRFGLVQMYRLKQGDPSIRNLLFNSLIKSYITYGLSAWGPSVTKKQFDTINTLIKSGLRCVAGINRKSHTGKYMKQYGQLRVTFELIL